VNDSAITFIRRFPRNREAAWAAERSGSSLVNGRCSPCCGSRRASTLTGDQPGHQSDGTINPGGFGAFNGVRPARILQTVVKVRVLRDAGTVQIRRP